MASAREEFTFSLRSLDRLLHENESLKVLQHNPSDPMANERGRIARNGVAVAAFALLEQFLKTRVREVLDRVSTSPLPFSWLPDALQTMTTTEVVNALSFQTTMMVRNRDDPAPLIRSTAASLVSTGSTPYELSYLAFGHARSNLNADDVQRLLAAFNVADPWANMTRAAQRIGLAPISLQDDFTSAARRRHRAAHQAATHTPLGDLQAFPAQALGIAIGFDALLSRAAFELTRGNRKYARTKKSLNETMIGIRFLESDNLEFRDRNEKATRAAQRGARNPVLAGCLARARKVGAIVVERERGTPRAWELTDLGPGRP